MCSRFLIRICLFVSLIVLGEGFVMGQYELRPSIDLVMKGKPAHFNVPRVKPGSPDFDPELEYVFSQDEKLIPPISAGEKTKLIRAFKELLGTGYEFTQQMRPKGAVFGYRLHNDRTITILFESPERLTKKSAEEIQEVVRNHVPLWRVHLATAETLESTLIYFDQIVIPDAWNNKAEEYWAGLSRRERVHLERTMGFRAKVNAKYLGKLIANLSEKDFPQFVEPKVIAVVIDDFPGKADPSLIIFYATDNLYEEYKIGRHGVEETHTIDCGPGWIGSFKFYGVQKDLSLVRAGRLFLQKEESERFIGRIYSSYFQLENFDETQACYMDPRTGEKRNLKMPPRDKWMTFDAIRNQVGEIE